MVESEAGEGGEYQDVQEAEHTLGGRPQHGGAVEGHHGHPLDDACKGEAARYVLTLTMSYLALPRGPSGGLSRDSLLTVLTV